MRTVCPAFGQAPVGPDGDGVRVLHKAGAVLDSLAAGGEANASRLAEAIGEPRSTVYRLLNTLMQLGMVETGQKRGTFALGIELMRLGAAVQARFDERTAGLPVIERIHDETGETVFLCLRRDWDAVCIERLAGRRVEALALRLGGVLPLHAGAASRALLAHESRELWEEYIAQGPLMELTAETPTSKEALFELLEEARRDGYAISDGDVTTGIAAIGAPVFDHRGHVTAALSIAGVRPAILGADAFEEMVGLVVEGAREISAALGFRPRSVVPE